MDATSQLQKLYDYIRETFPDYIYKEQEESFVYELVIKKLEEFRGKEKDFIEEIETLQDELELTDKQLRRQITGNKRSC